jgi:hypothetical protein
MRSALLVFVLILAMSCATTAADLHEVVSHLGRFFPIADSSYASLGRSLVAHGYEQSVPRDIGFGAKLVTFDNHLDKTSIYIHLLVVDYRIAEGYLYLPGDYNKAILDKALRPLFPENGVFEADGVSYWFHFPDVMQDFSARVAGLLGEQRKIVVPEALRESYARLVNPLYETEYGSFCGWGGMAPLGREAINTLIEQ